MRYQLSDSSDEDDNDVSPIYVPDSDEEADLNLKKTKGEVIYILDSEEEKDLPSIDKLRQVFQDEIIVRLPESKKAAQNDAINFMSMCLHRANSTDTFVDLLDKYATDLLTDHQLDLSETEKKVLITDIKADIRDNLELTNVNHLVEDFSYLFHRQSASNSSRINKGKTAGNYSGIGRSLQVLVLLLVLVVFFSSYLPLHDEAEKVDCSQACNNTFGADNIAQARQWARQDKTRLSQENARTLRKFRAQIHPDRNNFNAKGCPKDYCSILVNGNT